MTDVNDRPGGVAGGTGGARAAGLSDPPASDSGSTSSVSETVRQRLAVAGEKAEPVADIVRQRFAIAGRKAEAARRAATQKRAELTAQAKAKLPDPEDGPPLAGKFGFDGPAPTVGVGVAGRAVAEDLSELVKAEIALAKAEFTVGAKAKAMGAGAFAVAAVLGWLGLQALLITLGFVLALFLPGWVAALIVTLLLLAGAGVAAFVGKKKMATPVSLDTTKANVEQDVTTTKTSLGQS